MAGVVMAAGAGGLFVAAVAFGAGAGAGAAACAGRLPPFGTGSCSSFGRRDGVAAAATARDAATTAFSAGFLSLLELALGFGLAPLVEAGRWLEADLVEPEELRPFWRAAVFFGIGGQG
ncbi:MAG: hypothetical protein LW636_02425 [Planctomycetaceae bacterium]|jgi:hypothetical protein|nr:hypothetical protein [Planctomycetaceae bacterium]